MKKIAIATLIIGAALFTGCTSYGGNVSINNYEYLGDKSYDNKRFWVESDCDASYMDWIHNARIYNNNHIDAYKNAALLTKELGYKYFSIIGPKNYTNLLERKKVDSLKDILYECVDGDEEYSFFPDDDLGCNNILAKSLIGFFSERHMTISLEIEVHNDKRNSNLTFEPDTILNDEIVKDLDPSCIYPYVPAPLIDGHSQKK